MCRREKVLVARIGMGLAADIAMLEGRHKLAVGLREWTALNSIVYAFNACISSWKPRMIRALGGITLSLSVRSVCECGATSSLKRLASAHALSPHGAGYRGARAP
jgi:hypothetical protein